MRLTFDVDDEDEFLEAREALLGSFEAWPMRSAGEPGDVGVLLDWRFRYADGDLATWTTTDVERFLLEWLPAKVMMPPENAAPFVASMREFFPFLVAERLMGLGSSSIRALDAAMVRLAPRVAAALSDRSRFGMAKSLLSGFTDLEPRIDLDDPNALDVWRERVNALPADVRRRLLNLPGAGPEPDDDWDDAADQVPMPPALDVSLPDVVAGVDGHVLTDQIGAIRDFVADGRKLTKKGNLPVADAKELAGRLAVDQRALADDEFSIPRFVVRSADDLAELQLRMRLAQAAGAVRVVKGSMMATASWRKLSRVDAVTRVVRELLDQGPLTLATPDGAWVNTDVYEVLEDSLPHLLAFLFAAAGEPVPFDELVETAVEGSLHELDYAPGLAASSAPQQVAAAFTRLVEVLETAGVLNRTGDRAEIRPTGGTRQVGGDVALTPLARATLTGYLRENGYDVPDVGELADAPLSALVAAADEWHADRLEAEFDHWLGVHGPAAAADQLVGLADAREPHQRLLLVHLAGRLDPPGDEHVMRRLLDTALRGHATRWLLEHGRAVAIDQDAMLRAGIDLFACQLDDPGTFTQLLDSVDDLAAFIDQIWRVTDPAAGAVLAAIGQHHPDRATAKHARKALIRHRSHLANLNH